MSLLASSSSSTAIIGDGGAASKQWLVDQILSSGFAKCTEVGERKVFTHATRLWERGLRLVESVGKEGCT